ncbi:peptidase M50 [Cellulomonas flavigena DSM 20109]|uniref:Peptidase M50 n=1 Tax=Cellulomonas flavigena (strain ATCC 482 / DSM 20109 / BCRC 11376 / JCM 18109 / NBRC 3775 / NCIMB 8073 / NRS 134) TaxID=446466 RepID=D5UFA4_CELFN|nr:site-2 protease family protein [Cellulomonas flavigena]ADG74901.1 peptidase M50 [Cellulomonas flavigena DSM 20109]
MSDPRPDRPAGWVLGHVAGAPVVLARSWVLAAVVLTLVFAPSVRKWTGGGGALPYVVALVFVVLLFASVLVHELAHGLVGRSRGQQPHAFVLTLWGGHTTFGGAAASPATSALVAVVGPVANLVLAAAFLLIADRAAPDGTLLQTVLRAGALANGFVGLFNLVPGLPLDGGRILEAVVWAASGDRHRGTVAAGWTGRVVAVGVLLAALVRPWLAGVSPDLGTVAWSALIGAFLWSGASAAVRGGRTGRAVAALTLERVGRPAAVVGARTSLAQVRATAAAADVAEVVVLAPDGRPAAYVDTEAAGRVPADLAGTTDVLAVSTPLPVGAVVDGTLRGDALLQALSTASAHGPVVAALVDGRVAALVRTRDVVAALRG